MADDRGAAVLGGKAELVGLEPADLVAQAGRLLENEIGGGL